jgi:hypothetical protein
VTETSSAPDEESVWTSNRAKKTWASGVFVALGLTLEFAVASETLVATVLGSDLLLADVAFAKFRNGHQSIRFAGIKWKHCPIKLPDVERQICGIMLKIQIVNYRKRRDIGSE